MEDKVEIVNKLIETQLHTMKGVNEFLAKQAKIARDSVTLWAQVGLVAYGVIPDQQMDVFDTAFMDELKSMRGQVNELLSYLNIVLDANK